jgi:hypothetical protein
MATPTEKSPDIDAFIERVVGKNRRITILNDLCMACDEGATEFRDEPSRVEYTISGLCQACQDGVFA